MKESIRRIVMLCTILTFGLVLIFFDVTLIQLFFMMIVLVIVLPFLLGIATVDEVRSGLANMKKTGILKRLDEMKFFEKSSATKDKKTPVKAEKAPQKPAAADKTGGIVIQLKSIASSFGSLGNILKERRKQGKKVEDINKMLDKTVSEKLPSSPSPSAVAAATAGASLPAPGGAGGMPSGGDDTDPFLSLSGDEFDAGLLDGLDDDSPPEMPEEITPEGPVSGSAPDLPVPELSMPSMEASGDAAGGSGGLDEFSGIEGSGGLDAEFGDLDNLSLDDVEIDDDLGGPASPVETPDEAPPSGVPAAAPAATPKDDSGVVKTAWIASDAPAGADGMEDQIGIQSDMASFASSSHGTDEDLLSSIASDVKTVKKDKDLSLLRELKDFKAPATDIEDELKGMYQHISSGAKKKEGDAAPAPDGIK
jgi:hypothetical protein